MCALLQIDASPQGMFASYKLYLQEAVSAGPGHMNNKFLLSARKRKKQKKSNYLISLDEEDLAKNSGNVSVDQTATQFVSSPHYILLHHKCLCVTSCTSACAVLRKGEVQLRWDGVRDA